MSVPICGDEKQGWFSNELVRSVESDLTAKMSEGRWRESNADCFAKDVKPVSEKSLQNEDEGEGKQMSTLNQ